MHKSVSQIKSQPQHDEARVGAMPRKKGGTKKGEVRESNRDEGVA